METYNKNEKLMMHENFNQKCIEEQEELEQMKRGL
jgi:hypothetical protein